MKPRLRKFAIASHVAVSVGWLGAVVAFLGLAVIGLTSQSPQTVRGSYLVMEPVALFVLVPLAFASLLTGIIESPGTAWGLVRHYWVVFKLLINLVATAILLVYTQTVSVMAGTAADATADLDAVRNPSPPGPHPACTAAVAGGHCTRDLQTAGIDPIRAPQAVQRTA
jgi:ABC-type transport system involved in multi-copper enzyme maturation permease subunit